MAATIRVPDPCTEDWNAMPPAEGGRYCPRCDHAVPDLSRASDAELALRVQQGTLPACARFRADQLDRVLQPVHEDPVRMLQLLALGAMTVLPSISAAAKKEALHVAPSGVKPISIEQGEFLFIMGDVALPEPKAPTLFGFSVLAEQPLPQGQLVAGITSSTIDPSFCGVLPLLEDAMSDAHIQAKREPSPPRPTAPARWEPLAVLFRRLRIGALDRRSPFHEG